MKTKILFFILIISTSVHNASSIDGELTQTIKGKVVDQETQQPLIGAVITVSNTDPPIGTTTNEKGEFILPKIPVGRRNLKVSYVGYNPYVVSELLISSGKETVLFIEMTEMVTTIDQVMVKAFNRKDRSLNSMTTVSARVFSVEETSRYAGGFDDPARLATAFAGVASNNIQSNGITVRGNSPMGVQWRIEGVEVYNPNHFAGAQILGGGFVSFFSNQLLANSDFLTGAFPAEYGNALSAVFDIKLKTGNTDKREYTFQAGLMGFDLATEGPFVKGKQSSYLVNYRYSTFGLLQGLLPEGEGLPIYQDLCYKINIHTKVGTFSMWGAGAVDDYYSKAENDSTAWNMIDKRLDKHAWFNTLISGVSHKYILKHDAYVNSSLVYSCHSRTNAVKWMDNDLQLYDHNRISNSEQQIVFSSFINKKFSPAHINRTGIVLKQMYYDYNMQMAPERTLPLELITDENGTTQLVQFYTQSKIAISSALSATGGIHMQYFVLNDNYTIEPRIGLTWNATKTISFGIAYGKHSKIEELGYYLYEGVNDDYPNMDLDLIKAHHLVFSFDYRINENMRLKIEPYYQYLYDVPVIADSSFSIINMERYAEITEGLVNEGTGTNIGIDFTLERFLQKGYYYMITASLFDSKYTGGDHVERNTLFNKNYVTNILGGKEWNIGKNGKNNLLGLNGRLYFYGGNRQSPVLEEASLIEKNIIYDTERLFEEQEPSTLRVDLSVTFRRNITRYSSLFEIQLMNALGTVISTRQDIDFTENKVVEKSGRTIMPSLSWKIEF